VTDVVAPATDRIVIKARRPRFDLSTTPAAWIPGDPQTSHLMDSLHVVLPPGERWFCDVLKDAMPVIDATGDRQLREDVKGFIGQEATHAKAHDRGLEHLARHGIDLQSEVAWADRVRVRARKRIRTLPTRLQRRIMKHELAAIATIEHFTAVLGVWIVQARALDAAGADPVMLDLLRWHGAEEVEHRSVAFDAYMAIDGSYPRRVVHGVIGAVGLTLGLFAVGVRINQLDATSKRFSYRDYKAAIAAGRIPDMLGVAFSIREYLKRDYHPSQYGIEQVPEALAYLQTSPGVAARANSA
jgi:predicted metal-dependent hydrolase